MAKLLEFIRDWLHDRSTRKWEHRNYCKSCELLREQLAREIFEKDQLLKRFVFIQSPETIQGNTEVPQPVLSRIVPWRVQRELLEAEDRAKAATIRRQQADREKAVEEAKRRTESSEPIEANQISVAELEKELGVI